MKTLKELGVGAWTRWRALDVVAAAGPLFVRDVTAPDNRQLAFLVFQERTNHRPGAYWAYDPQDHKIVGVLIRACNHTQIGSYEATTPPLLIPASISQKLDEAIRRYVDAAVAD